MSNHVRSLWSLTSTTSVSPSQRPARVAHPEVDPFERRRAVRVDGAVHLRPLERHRDVVGRLEDLERELHVHDPRHAGQVAVLQRIKRLAILRVLDLLLRRPVLIRDRSALHDAFAGRHLETCDVIFEVCRSAGCEPARSRRGRACRQQSVELRCSRERPNESTI